MIINHIIFQHHWSEVWFWSASVTSEGMTHSLSTEKAFMTRCEVQSF